jgi:hypothetical protein
MLKGSAVVLGPAAGALLLAACGGSSNRITTREGDGLIAFSSLQHGIHNIYMVRADGRGFLELARNTYRGSRLVARWIDDRLRADSNSE